MSDSFNVAKHLGSLRKQFIDEGFSDDEAFALLKMLIEKDRV